MLVTDPLEISRTHDFVSFSSRVQQTTRLAAKSMRSSGWSSTGSSVIHLTCSITIRGTARTDSICALSSRHPPICILESPCGAMKPPSSNSAVSCPDLTILRAFAAVAGSSTVVTVTISSGSTTKQRITDNTSKRCKIPIRSQK
jgi:hypothetical protein